MKLNNLLYNTIRLLDCASTSFEEFNRNSYFTMNGCSIILDLRFIYSAYKVGGGAGCENKLHLISWLQRR